MESEAMPSSLAVLTSPRRELLAAMRTLDSDVLASMPSRAVTTQSGLQQLLVQAHSHVDAVMARLDDDEREAGEAGGEDVTPAVSELEHTPVSTMVRQIISNALMVLKSGSNAKKGGTAAGLMLLAADVGEERYKRLKADFTRLVHHVKDVDEHRKQLNRALDELHTSTVALMVDGKTPSTSHSVGVTEKRLQDSLAESIASIDDVKIVLDRVVTKQTNTKLEEFQRFEEKLEAREQLRHEVEAAEKKIQQMQARISTSGTRGHKGGTRRAVAQQELAAKHLEFHRLRRRLAVMTEALEHVFCFHFQLDQCIAEPELQAVHRELGRFFARKARAFAGL